MIRPLPHHRFGLALIGLLLFLALPLPGAPPAPAASGAVPARIILTWSGDPATTQSVTWQTQSALATPQGQVVKMSPHPDFEASAHTVPGRVTTEANAGTGTATHYAVEFSGLDPETKYQYRVGDGTVWSEWNVFRTAANKPQPFRFIYVGDAQNSIKSMWSRTIRAAFATAPDARFIASAGDLVAEGWDDRLWGEWCEAQGFITAMIPSVPAPGNHDEHRPPGLPDSKKVLTVAPPWRAYFALPQNGPEAPELKSAAYFIDYQGLRFVVVDANVFANEDFVASEKERVWKAQVAWLERTLSNNPNHWTIVMQHQPIYAMAHGREYTEMREALAPLYEKYGVDLVLQGHDHHYSRTHKISRDRIGDPAQPGVIYAISVSGPKMYEVDQLHRPLQARVLMKTQCFQIVAVSPTALQYTAYSVDGAVVDSFELTKSGKVSTYVNHAPAE